MVGVYKDKKILLLLTFRYKSSQPRHEFCFAVLHQRFSHWLSSSQQQLF